MEKIFGDFLKISHKTLETTRMDLWMWVPLEIEDIDEFLTEEERESIKVVQISQEDVDHNLECAICLVDFVVNEEARELNCGGHHKYHQLCLFTWLENKRSCPMCRERLNYDNEEAWFDALEDLNEM